MIFDGSGNRQVQVKSNWTIILFIISGLCLIFSYPPIDFGWLIWVALVPALFACFQCKQSQKRHFGLGYILGVLYFGGTFWWIGYVTVPGTVALVLYLALYPAAWFWAVGRWRDRVSGAFGSHLILAAGGASLWVVLEWTRGWALTGFTWNYLGVALHRNVAMMQLASLGGVHLLSWLIVAVNLLGALGVERFCLQATGRLPRRAHLEILTAVGLSALTFAWGLHRALEPDAGPERSLRYGCIQPNVPQNAYLPEMSTIEILERHAELTTTAAKENPQLMIWPEADTGEMVGRDGLLRSLVEGIGRQDHFYLLLGSEDEEEKRLYNSAFLFTPGAAAFQKYDKNRLVFFGEYTPLGDTFPVLRRRSLTRPISRRERPR